MYADTAISVKSTGKSKVYMGAEVELQTFLTSVLDGSEQSTSRPGPFTTGERALGNH